MKLIDFNTIPALAPRYKSEPLEPRGVHVVVETPRGQRNKFAYNEEYGLLELSRTLKAGMMWPCDFGFIPQTLAGDGDALDVALMLDEPTFPGCLVRARLLGVIGFVKNGEENDRLVACPAAKRGSGSRWDGITDIAQMQERTLRELESFLTDYNVFEGHKIRLTGWRDADSALEAVRVSAANYKAQHERG